MDWARMQVADLIKAETNEILWTSGATESINLALKGAAELYRRKGKHIVTLKTEHKAVLDTCQQLEKKDYQVTYLSPEKNGLLNITKLKEAFREDTILVSIMHVNNEIGIIQDLASIAELTSSKNILLHVDAAQSIGKLPIDVSKTPIDLLSMNAHKVYGPKGIGALYIRKKPRVRVAAQLHGGGQEQGIRSGTLPTHQIVGMGEAFRLAKLEMDADIEKIISLREKFFDAIAPLNFKINGDSLYGYPGIINLQFQGVRAERLMRALPDLALAAGSACNAKGIEPSYVLRALGLNLEEAYNSVRFSFGRFTQEVEILKTAELLNQFFKSVD